MVMWVFGYASLIWKAGFDYDERIIGFIKGYRRTFHLACFEHRGTEDLPARVATVEPDDESICWGVAFCIKDAGAAERAMAYLHKRESEYDIVMSVEVYTEDSPNTPVVTEARVFMSTLDQLSNKYYLGSAPKEAIARQIATATGPSGPNCDYLFRLVEALREIGHEDLEVVELAVAVRRMLSECKAQASQPSTSASPRSLLAGQSLGPLPRLIMSGPIQLGPVGHSPRLLKSQAQ